MRPDDFSMFKSHVRAGSTSNDAGFDMSMLRIPVNFILKSRHAAAVWAGVQQRNDAFSAT